MRIPEHAFPYLSHIHWPRVVALVTLLPSPTSYSQIEEVLVTAQHREQSLFDVPIGMTVFTDEQLGALRIDNIDGLSSETPGLSGWQQGLSTPIYALRGISTNSFGIGGESSIGIFVDDAYLGRINSTSVRMPDVARVEILKGPQGTLLGRNASAGAIHYHTQLPTPDTEAQLRLLAGDYETREIGVTANAPLVGDALLGRVTAFYREQRGDVRNRIGGYHVGGEDGHGIRLALAYLQGPLSLDLSVSSQELSSGGLGYETLDPDLAAAGGVAPDPFDDELATDIRTFDDIESDDANLRIGWEISDRVRLRSITAWHQNDSPNLFDVDGSAVFLTSAGFTDRTSETWSQEFRFTGETDSLEWLAGISWFEEEVSTRIDLGYSDTNRLAGTPISPSDFGFPFPDFILCDAVSDFVFGPCLDEIQETALHEGDYSSLGVYGDISWSVDDRLTLTAGVRYGRDDKDFTYRSEPVQSVTTALNSLLTAPLNPSGNLLGYSTDGWESLSEDWDAWQPRLAMAYAFQADATFYVNLARGYKAGGFEPSATPSLSVYDPETVDSFDVGLRGFLLDGRLFYDLSAYYYENDDYQVQVIENGVARTINSAGVTGSGIDWELRYSIEPALQLRLHGAYTDATFDDDDGSDFGGNRTILTPRHSLGLSIDYRSPNYAWGSLGAGWQSQYQSDIFYSVQNDAEASRPDLQLHHLRLSYFSVESRWQLNLLARNLFDKDYTIFQQDVGAGLVSRRGMPRHLLAEIRFDY